MPSGEKKFLLAHCHVKEEPLTDELKAQFPADSVFQGLNKVVLMEPPAPHGNGDNCICNSGTAPAVVTLLFLFSVCVQAAEGLSFGIVPYISRPALGVVSGMVGAGGNGGAVAMLNLFFKGPPTNSRNPPRRGASEWRRWRDALVEDIWKCLRADTACRDKAYVVSN